MLYKMLKNTPRKTRRSLLTAALLLCTLALHAQETGQWRAASNTASSITGDIALAPNRLIINFVGFTISRIRGLGWQPKRSIREAVELTVDWLDANRWVFAKGH